MYWFLAVHQLAVLYDLCAYVFQMAVLCDLCHLLLLDNNFLHAHRTRILHAHKIHTLRNS
jgi:hypothetical protein